MAKRTTMKEAPKKTGVDEAEFRRIITEYGRQRANASEYAGHAGKIVSSAIEQHGLDRAAFSFVLKLSKMEEGKRQSTIRALMPYIVKAGYFDQVDAFSDLLTELEALVAELRGKAPKAPAKGAATLAGLMPH